MDFKLSKTHLLQQEMFRRFAENEVKPLAEEMDETEVFNRDLLAKLQKYGLMGNPIFKGIRRCGRRLSGIHPLHGGDF